MKSIQGSRIGVVTVTYNSAAYLPDFFQSLAAQSENRFQVYAIDNASSDASAVLLREHAAGDRRLIVIANDRNGGVAAGNNQGIERALRDGCEWILLLNNDTKFDATFFIDLIDRAARSHCQVVVPKIYFDQPPGSLWYAGGGFNSLKGYTGYHTGMGQRDVGQFDGEVLVEYSPTCAMLVHSDIFRRVGLMDETYFVYFDDTDFCWRLRQNGIAIAYAPGATLVHKVGGSTGGAMSPFSARYTARNRLYFLKKYFGAVAAVAWRIPFLGFYTLRFAIFSWRPASLRASWAGSFSYGKLRPNIPDVPKLEELGHLS